MICAGFCLSRNSEILISEVQNEQKLAELQSEGAELYAFTSFWPL